MSKITLNSVGSLIDTTTAANTINTNSVTVQTAFDNTLSRDGTNPNQMSANLDMNSNHILNCPAPISGGEPVRLTDLAAYATGGTVTFNALPVGGTIGQMLTKNSSGNYDASWLNGPTLGSTLLAPNTTYSTITGTVSFATLSSTNKIYVGTSPTTDDTAFLACRPLTPGSGLLNSHAYRDETIATQNVTGGQFSGYAAFDAAPIINGVCTTSMNHIHGFQSRPVYNSTGTVSEVAGLTTQSTITNAAGIIANSYGVLVTSPIITAGGIANQYAFYSNPLSGATNSYFLYGSGGSATGNPSVIGGKIYIGGLLNSFAQEYVNISFNGSAQQGLALVDTYAPAATLTAMNLIRNNATVGSISTTLTTTAYNTSSDERRKDFIGEYAADKAIAIIKADPVRDFTWKTTGEYAVGWGAQTSYEISPDLATKPENSDDWSVDQSKRTPYLWAAVSNILDRLETLENA